MQIVDKNYTDCVKSCLCKGKVVIMMSAFVRNAAFASSNTLVMTMTVENFCMVTLGLM